jgi:hypothetical protein
MEGGFNPPGNYADGITYLGLLYPGTPAGINDIPLAVVPPFGDFGTNLVSAVVTFGLVPPGLTFDDSDLTNIVLTGIVGVNDDGPYYFEVTFTWDDDTQAVARYTLGIQVDPNFLIGLPTVEASGQVAVIYAQTVDDPTNPHNGAATVSTREMTFGVLPTGITYDPLTKALAGTPAAAQQGAYYFEITYTYSDTSIYVARYLLDILAAA